MTIQRNSNSASDSAKRVETVGLPLDQWKKKTLLELIRSSNIPIPKSISNLRRAELIELCLKPSKTEFEGQIECWELDPERMQKITYKDIEKILSRYSEENEARREKRRAERNIQYALVRYIINNGTESEPLFEYEYNAGVLMDGFLFGTLIEKRIDPEQEGFTVLKMMNHKEFKAYLEEQKRRETYFSLVQQYGFFSKKAWIFADRPPVMEVTLSAETNLPVNEYKLNNRSVLLPYKLDFQYEE